MDLTWGLVISAFNWALIISLMLARRPALAPRLLSVFALTLLLLCVPVAGISPVYFLRAIFGEFSITATVLLSVIALSKVQLSQLPKRDIFCLATILAPLSLWFYPMSLGLTLHDPYQLGFDASVLSAVLLSAGFIAWLRGYYLIVAAISLSLVAFRFNLLESNNLWDYVIDPCVAFFALYHVGAVLRRSRRAKATTQEQDREHDQVPDNGRVIEIKRQALRGKEPVVAREYDPGGEQHCHRYAEPGELGAATAAKKAE